MLYDAGSKPFRKARRMEYASAIATMSTPRAPQDMERYLAVLAKHDPPSDRDVLNAWEKMLDTGRAPSDAPRPDELEAS
jgi:hypothetical protein